MSGNNHRQIFSLEQIAAREAADGIILFDTCAVDIGLPQRTYEYDRYRKIPEQLLTGVVYAYKCFIDFIGQEHVFTVGGVERQLRILCELFAEKTRFWNMWENGYKQDVETPRSQQVLVRELNKLSLRIAQRARHALYVPEDPTTYRSLYAAVLQLDEVFQLRRNRSRYGPKPWQIERSYEDIHREEQLVAMAVYLALAEGKRPAIVTSDRDIPTIMVAVEDMLEASPAPQLREALERLRQNPPRIYLGEGKALVPYRLDFDTEAIDAHLTDALVREAPVSAVMDLCTNFLRVFSALAPIAPESGIALHPASPAQKSA